ncbi:hypothetical protein QC823_15935 [Halomonas vilamensis]|uniref:Uncharacterized protein n=1 Tax=Vreelandella vilamensis TaxID=531309 RepID=A0ABU1H825_9GAMM|nr:hypothetical protein [Halomonas vilamensis]MDR5900454.1 hypothetical protein [Halomonas vilamensis]
MSISQHYYGQAAELLVAKETDTASHSEAYWQGYLDAVAWCLAGQPPNHQHEQPYLPGTLMFDAWAYGKVNGIVFAKEHVEKKPQRRFFWGKNPA